MINNHWNTILQHEFKQNYMQNLKQFLQTQKHNKKVIYPHSKNWFNAFKLTDLPDIKIIILGQDPYHQPSQAHGLSFSVPKTTKIPPSLQNIFKEITNDIADINFSHGNLENWAKQGVFLLNSVLTVEQSNAGSHANQGWEIFTDNIIKIINEKTTHTVFMLWGAYAQNKNNLINADTHLVLSAPHPSPLSAYRGFFGCQHFSKANKYLQKYNKKPINWDNN